MCYETLCSQFGAGERGDERDEVSGGSESSRALKSAKVSAGDERETPRSLAAGSR